MLDLDNAKEVYINGKEVKKLMIGNRVIWEKISVGGILLTSDKSILSASDHESALLTAQLLDGNDNPISVSNKTVDFYKIVYINDNVSSFAFDLSDYISSQSIVNICFSNDVLFYNKDIILDDDYVYLDDLPNDLWYGKLLTIEKTNGGVNVYVDGVLGSTKPVNNQNWQEVRLHDFSGQSVDYIEVNEKIGTGTTNSSGQCSVYYNAMGTGDISIKAICGNVYSNNLQLEDCIKSYKLDGTETVITIPDSYTPVIVDNTFENGAGYLSDGWVNSTNWKCEFDYYVRGHSNGWMILASRVTSRDYNNIQFWGTSLVIFRNNGTEITRVEVGNCDYNMWCHMEVIKRGENFTVKCGDSEQTVAWANGNATDELYIGLDQLNAFRSGYSTIKNIKIKSL